MACGAGAELPPERLPGTTRSELVQHARQNLPRRHRRATALWLLLLLRQQRLDPLPKLVRNVVTRESLDHDAALDHAQIFRSTGFEICSKRGRGAELARAAKSLADHPLGDVVLEDLASARDHGRETCRVGVAADGNPIIYSRSRSTLERVGGALRRGTRIHARHIPDLDVEQWEAIAAQAESKMLPEGEGE
jgi:hypothetical protein